MGLHHEPDEVVGDELLAEIRRTQRELTEDTLRETAAAALERVERLGVIADGRVSGGEGGVAPGRPKRDEIAGEIYQDEIIRECRRAKRKLSRGTKSSAAPAA